MQLYLLVTVKGEPFDETPTTFFGEAAGMPPPAWTLRQADSEFPADAPHRWVRLVRADQMGDPVAYLVEKPGAQADELFKQLQPAIEDAVATGCHVTPLIKRPAP